MSYSNQTASLWAWDAMGSQALVPDVLEIQRQHQAIVNTIVDGLVFEFGIQALADRFAWYDWLEANPVSKPKWRRD